MSLAGFRTRNPSKRTAVGPRLTPRGYCDRQIKKHDKKYSWNDGCLLFYVASSDYVCIIYVTLGYQSIILPVVLYGCETWSLTLREERKLRVFENLVLR